MNSYSAKAVECKLIFVSKIERIDGLTYILVHHVTAYMFGEALMLTPLCNSSWLAAIKGRRHSKKGFGGFLNYTLKHVLCRQICAV